MISVLRSWWVEELALEHARDLRLRDDALDERPRRRARRDGHGGLAVERRPSPAAPRAPRRRSRSRRPPARRRASSATTTMRLRPARRCPERVASSRRRAIADGRSVACTTTPSCGSWLRTSLRSPASSRMPPVAIASTRSIPEARSAVTVAGEALRVGRARGGDAVGDEHDALLPALLRVRAGPLERALEVRGAERAVARAPSPCRRRRRRPPRRRRSA